MYRFVLPVLFTALLCLPLADAFAQTQMELNQQAADDYQNADAELNKVYKETLHRLEPEQQESVRATQRAWLKYRDLAKEEAGMMYEGGSIRPLIEFGTVTEMTTFRTRQLKALLEP